MEDFKESQFKNYSPAVKVVNNKLRFNKNVEKSEERIGGSHSGMPSKTE